MSIYGAGLLVAADRSDRQVWADHRARLEAGVVPTTTAPVVAQVSRSPRQVQLRRFLRGCRVAPFGVAHAHDVGALLGRPGSADRVDARVVLCAAASSSTIWTSDAGNLRRLTDQLSFRLDIRSI